MEKMRVLGIDPGPKESAYCVWDGEKIQDSGKVPTEAVLDVIYKASTFNETCVACEHLQCFGMGVGKEVFETAYWIGDFRGHCRHHGIKFIPVFRGDVKSYWCQSQRATDSNIRFALEDRFGPKGTKKNPGLMYPLVGSDMRSAFAIAVMVHDKSVRQA